MVKKSKKKQVRKEGEPSGTTPVTPPSTQSATSASGATQPARSASGATQTSATASKSTEPPTSSTSRSTDPLTRESKSTRLPSSKSNQPLKSPSGASQPTTSPSGSTCDQPASVWAKQGQKKQGYHDQRSPGTSGSTQPSSTASTSAEYKSKSAKNDDETGSYEYKPSSRPRGAQEREQQPADSYSSRGVWDRPHDRGNRGRGRGRGLGQQDFIGGPQKPGEFPASGERNRPRFQQQPSGGGEAEQWPVKKQQGWWKDTKQKDQLQEAPNVSHEQPKRKNFGNQGETSQGAPDKVQAPSTSLQRGQSIQVLSKASTSTDQSETQNIEFKKPGQPGTLARKKIKVQSNHFALQNLDALKDAYHYRVDITSFDKGKKSQEKSPETSQSQATNKNKPRKIKNKLFYKVVEKFLEKHFPNRFPSYDGQHSLYASTPLTNNLHDELIDNDITIDSLGKKKNFGIKIKWVATISLLLQQEDGSSQSLMLTDNAKQCLDVIFRNAPIHCFNQIGPCFFRQPTPDKIIDLGGGMEMYYGFYQSVVNGGRRPYLNVHLVHKAFPKNLPVLDAFLELLQANDRRKNYTYNDLTSLQTWQIKILNDYIKNLKVLYTPPQSKVIYKVNALARSPKEEILTLDDGRQVSVLEYYKSEKRYSIKYPDIPLLHVGNVERNILIPPELCRIEKDQSVKKQLDRFQKQNMIQKAATNTHLHRTNLMERFQEAGYNDSDCVRTEFGFSVSNQFEVMEARVLPTPTLQYGTNSVPVFKGKWSSNNKFWKAKTLKKWAIVNVSNDRYVNEGVIHGFIMELKRAARECGIEIESQPYVSNIEGRGRYPPARDDIKRYFEKAKTANYDIIFVIIPGSEQGNTSTYSVVKCVAELNFGCLTQCVKATTIANKRFNTSTAKNILLKVNGKLDGINHIFTDQCKPKILDDYVMVMGADVTHPGRDATMPSIAAVIASHDPKAFRYNLCWRLQRSNLEDIVDLKAIVKEQLLYYFKKNGVKPEKIIFFRDGVSEGQFIQVLARELTAIKDACKEMDSDYNPSVTFLVVQKRHHTRLFPLTDRDSEDPDVNCNVPAGTCVDTTIVDPTIENFYLVSHASIKGVARPTKYCTLYDDLDLSNDEIQELSYYLCHMFARCTRSVSYPAPTYYAHLGALRGKAYIKPEVDVNRFNIDNLPREMAHRRVQENILVNNPMFFI